jgi:hypothetical protein
MPPRKLKEKRKAPTPKMVKEVPQESAAVLWLMERTGFDKNELVCVPALCAWYSSSTGRGGPRGPLAVYT